jgi:hypothetical protein
LEELCQLAGTKPDGKSVKDFVRDRTEQGFQNLLRTLADEDAERASKLARFFEAMKRGDFR